MVTYASIAPGCLSLLGWPGYPPKWIYFFFGSASLVLDSEKLMYHSHFNVQFLVQCPAQSLHGEDNHWNKIDGLNKRNKGENETQRKRENGSAWFLSMRIWTHFSNFLLRLQETDNHVTPNIYRTCSGRGHGTSHFSRDETETGKRVVSLTIAKVHASRWGAKSGQWFFLLARPPSFFSTWSTCTLSMLQYPKGEASRPLFPSMRKSPAIPHNKQDALALHDSHHLNTQEGEAPWTSWKIQICVSDRNTSLTKQQGHNSSSLGRTDSPQCYGPFYLRSTSRRPTHPEPQPPLLGLA